MAFAAAPREQDAMAAAELGRQLATLVFAATAPAAGPGVLGQVIACRNELGRLGMDPPLFAVYDLQRLLSGAELTETDAARPVAGRVLDRRGLELFARYAGLMRSLAQTSAIQALARRPLPVEFEAVLVARLLTDAYRRWAGAGPRPVGPGLLPTSTSVVATPPAELALRHDPVWALSFMSHVVAQRDLIIARSEQIDLGPLRLLGMFPGSAPADLLDLYNLLGSSVGGRAVEFSLQLLPSVLETKRSTAAQRLTIDGYASVERRGSLDALLPSELAHDADIFHHKVLTDELLFYGHERRLETVLREHWVLVDASASMRGLREICARGLAVALAKKLSLHGDAVSLRFFDSRLHRRIPVGAAGGHELPHILSFRSERGRHYARVFDDLLDEARRLKRRGGRELSVTFITHGECHIPQALVESLAGVCRLYGIFVLPSRPLALSYLPVLHQHQILAAGDFANSEARKRRGLHILEDVARAHS